MVLAGPGTGKTFTVIQRIKHMLTTGFLPESILCLTFSEAAANEMKARLVKEMGTVASAVSIHTYHAFCNELIAQYPNQFELLDGVSLVDDISRRNLMRECIDEYKPTFYRTRWGDAYYYINDLIRACDEIKKNQVSKDLYCDVLNNSPDWQGKLDKLMIEKAEREASGKALKTFLKNLETHERKMGKAKEAWDIYEKYSLKLKQNNFIDFNDMINMVLEAFDSDETFLKRVSRRYLYFLIDEYQDTNYSQNQIVFRLAQGAGHENIFVVGDDDQIIYGFQGAQTDNLEKFLKRYPQTRVICLEENNRSTQTILDLSYRVISQDKLRLENNQDFASYNISKRLTAKNPNITCNDKPVQIHGFGDIKQENNHIVDTIASIISSAPKTADGETDLSQIAILTRQNYELNEFAELLKAKNIPFQTKSSKSIFELKPSILIYFYLKMLANNELYADKIFGLLLSKPFDFEPADYNFLLEQNRLNHKDFVSNIRINTNREWGNPAKVKAFIETYDNLKEIKANETLKNLVIAAINRTGILDYYVDSPINRIENIASIKKVVDEAASFGNLYPTACLQDFLNHLDMAFEDEVPLCIDKDDYVQNAVQLLTLHGAKGREFEYVFMPNLTSRSWEKKREPNGVDLPIERTSFSDDDESAKMAEQLRLLFVGLTRAKHSLHLSYSYSIGGKPVELTSYLAKISEDADLFEAHNHELSDEDFALEVVKSLKQAEFNYTRVFEEEIRARVKDFRLSPSTLNSYLNCPREFLYSQIYKIPVYDKDSNDASYGSAFHRTLEWAVSVAKDTRAYPSYAEAKDAFIKHLGSQRFLTKTKREEYIDRGIKSLTTYYPSFCETTPERVLGIEVKLDFVPVGDYFVKGFIDRVEKNNDGTYSLYDYKTGSAKAKTQIADGKDYEHYLNQLRFYKLAFETINTGAKVSQVGLLFVEEHDKSFYTRLTEEDNDIIRDKILTSYKNIEELNFAPVISNTKSADSCQYCDYKMLCKIDNI